jgi:hypothetical protein
MIRFAMLPCLAALAVAGCSSPEVQPLSEDEMVAVRHLQAIGAAYNRAYQARRKPPASANDLKPYLKPEPGARDPFVSPRDGQPIVIVPGVAMDVRPASDDEQMIVAYERDGVNGKRLTVDVRGTIVPYTAEQFAKLKFAGGHQPAGR